MGPRSIVVQTISSLIISIRFKPKKCHGLSWDMLRAGREAMSFSREGAMPLSHPSSGGCCWAAFARKETSINAFTATKAKHFWLPPILARLSRALVRFVSKSGHFDWFRVPVYLIVREEEEEKKKKKKPVKSWCCQPQKAATHKAPRWPFS